jgi:hypothetical protein
MFRDVGEMPMDRMNGANVPVVCFLYEPGPENGGMWVWSATNFMPRKKSCGSSWRIEADTREEIMEALRKYVIPLYEIALANLKERGENYYWERDPAIGKRQGA